MDSNLTVRYATSKDYKIIQSIYDDSYIMRLKSGQMRENDAYMHESDILIDNIKQLRQINKESFILLAQKEHTYIGYIVYSFHPSIASISQFHTRPNTDKVGSFLMTTFTKNALQKGIRKASVIPSFWSRDIYKHFGFTPDQPASARYIKNLSP